MDIIGSHAFAYQLVIGKTLDEILYERKGPSYIQHNSCSYGNRFYLPTSNIIITLLETQVFHLGISRDAVLKRPVPI